MGRLCLEFVEGEMKVDTSMLSTLAEDNCALPFERVYESQHLNYALTSMSVGADVYCGSGRTELTVPVPQSTRPTRRALAEGTLHPWPGSL